MSDSPNFFLLTRDGQRVLDNAAAVAHAERHEQTQPDDLLTAVLNTPGTLVLKVLERLPIDLASLRQTVGATALPAGAPPKVPPGLAKESAAVLGYASKEAQHLGHGQVDAIHILMGFLYESSTPLYATLTAAGLSLYELRQQFIGQKTTFQSATKSPSVAGWRPSPVFLVPLLLMIGTGIALWRGLPESWVTGVTFGFAMSGWITAVCIHEFGHALIAYLGGDTSVRDKGYLTLNPLKYTHPFFSLVIPLIFMVSGGIGLPGAAVYIDRFALRNAWWDRMTSAGGPIGTVIFIVLTMWPFAFDWWGWVTPANFQFWPALAFMGFLQVTALVFNLIPLPPLDGWGIIAPSFTWETRIRVSQYGSFSLLLLFILLNSNSSFTDQFWMFVFRVAGWFNLPYEMIAIGFEQFSFW